MEMTNKILKPMLNTLAGYEPKHESNPFSINDAKDVTASLISNTAAIQGLKYNMNPNKPVIWLQRLMNEYSVDYIKDLYLEDIHFMQDKPSDESLKHRLLFLKLQDATQQHIQQSLKLHFRCWKKDNPI